MVEPMPDPPMTNVGVQRLVPLLMVQDMDRSLRFYAQGLQFDVKNTWTPEGRIRWCWLELGGAALMLQEWVANDPRRTNPREHVGAGVGFNYQCQDAIAFYKIAKARGLSVETPFVGNSMWVTSLIDPDGYRLHFASPTNAPEESQYQE
jgi:lactoylglutathione lyase